MRIAGGIIGIFLALIILVQSLAAGTANALAVAEEEQDSSGSIGFVVALLFVVGSALLIGKVLRGAMWVWAAAAVVALLGAVGAIFTDLYAWSVVAIVYTVASYLGVRKARAARSAPVEVA